MSSRECFTPPPSISQTAAGPGHPDQGEGEHMILIIIIIMIIIIFTIIIIIILYYVLFSILFIHSIILFIPSQQTLDTEGPAPSDYAQVNIHQQEKVSLVVFFYSFFLSSSFFFCYKTVPHCMCDVSPVRLILMSVFRALDPQGAPSHIGSSGSASKKADSLQSEPHHTAAPPGPPQSQTDTTRWAANLLTRFSIGLF